jgi:hypothetical protein
VRAKDGAIFGQNLFYQAKLKKQINPDIFITYLEGLGATMGDIESFITDTQFIMQVLMNNLNKDYENTIKNLDKLITTKMILSQSSRCVKMHASSMIACMA